MLPKFYRFVYCVEWSEPIGPQDKPVLGLYSTKKAFGINPSSAEVRARRDLQQEITAHFGNFANFTEPAAFEVDNWWQEPLRYYLFSKTPNRGFTYWVE